MKKIILTLILGACASTSFAQSTTTESGWFGGPQISTLGVGVNLGHQFNNQFALRANVNGFGYSHNFGVNDIDYDGHLRLLTAGLLADYHPFSNGFKVTGGLYYNDNRITADGHYNNGNVNIGGISVNPNQYGQFNASAKFNSLAPYAGIGYQSIKPKGFSFTADLGVLYQGNAKLSYNASCYDPNNLVCQAALPALQAKADQEKTDLQHKFNNYKWYPVVSLGAVYKF